ncbi:MAG: hypothetical protein AB7I79_05650 [Rhizobiaceae bacterium]
MANAARKSDEPRYTPDPFNPIPPLGADSVDPRTGANDPHYVENRVSVQSERRTGASVLVAAIVIVLAAIAYFMFSGNDEAVVPAGDAPAVTAPETTTPPVAEPEATAPTAPADPATPQPESAAPVETAPAEPVQPDPTPEAQ